MRGSTKVLSSSHPRPDKCFDIVSDILVGSIFGRCPNIFAGILCDILSDILSGFLSGIYIDIPCGILSGIFLTFYLAFFWPSF